MPRRSDSGRPERSCRRSCAGRPAAPGTASGRPVAHGAHRPRRPRPGRARPRRARPARRRRGHDRVGQERAARRRGCSRWRRALARRGLVPARRLQGRGGLRSARRCSRTCSATLSDLDPRLHPACDREPARRAAASRAGARRGRRPARSTSCRDGALAATRDRRRRVRGLVVGEPRAARGLRRPRGARPVARPAPDPLHAAPGGRGPRRGARERRPAASRCASPIAATASPCSATTPRPVCRRSRAAGPSSPPATAPRDACRSRSPNAGDAGSHRGGLGAAAVRSAAVVRPAPRRDHARSGPRRSTAGLAVRAARPARRAASAGRGPTIRERHGHLLVLGAARRGLDDGAETLAVSATPGRDAPCAVVPPGPGRRLGAARPLGRRHARRGAPARS